MKQFLLLFMLIPCIVFSQNDTDLDNTFNSGSPNFNSQIVETNGKYLVYSYTYIAPNYIGTLHRLNNNGTVDNTFNFTGNFIGSQAFIELQSDGKIIVCFAKYNNKGVTRFNSDGTIDNSFNLIPNITPRIIKLQNDGKIVYVGFSNTGDNNSSVSFGRLNSDGSSDTGFLTGTSFSRIGNSPTPTGITTIKIANDGKIIIGGNFNRYNGNTTSGIARLNYDGTLDNTFITGSGFDYNWTVVLDIEIQADGKIVAGGGFSTYNGASSSKLIRINTNGTKDNTFNPSINNEAYDIEIENGGKIIVGGTFTVATGGISKNRLCRFNSNGSIDSNFDILTGFNNSVLDVTIDSNNKILIGGQFTTYKDNSVNNIIRLKGTSNLSNDDFVENKINIYPNPVRETIYLYNVGQIEYEIFDILGKSILRGINNENQINVNSIENGVYILKLKTREKISNQKFIKE